MYKKQNYSWWQPDTQLSKGHHTVLWGSAEPVFKDSVALLSWKCLSIAVGAHRTKLLICFQQITHWYTLWSQGILHHRNYLFLFQGTGTSLMLLICYWYSKRPVQANGFVECKTLVWLFHTKKGHLRGFECSQFGNTPATSSGQLLWATSAFNSSQSLY